MNSVWDKIVNLKPDWNRIPPQDIYHSKMNKDYFYICYSNLFEKYLCEGITEEDFKKIKNKLSEYKEKQDETLYRK